jgi:hypothetical protein
MELRINPRPTPVDSREFKTVRIDGQSVQSRSAAAAHAPVRPQEHAKNPETRSEFAEAYRSAARARKAKRRLRRLFATARRNGRAERAFVELTSTKFCAVPIASYGPMPRSRLAAAQTSSSC